MAIKFLNDQLFPTDVFLVDVSAGRVGIGTLLPASKLEVGLGLSTGSDGIFVKGEFAGGTAFANSKNPFISLGTSTSAGYTSAIYLGSSATATGQESKIEFNRSNNALSIYYKGQGTDREHVRFGDPSNSTPKSVFFGNVGINAVAPTQKLHVAGNMRLENQLFDSNNSQGNTGQVLTKISQGTLWADSITGVTAGTALTGGGTSGNVTLNVSTAGVSLLGGANIPTSTANRNYVIQHQDTVNQTLVVNVPWVSGIGEVEGAGTINGLTLTGNISGSGASGSLTLGGTLSIGNADWSGADLSVVNGGTGASTASVARTNLGVINDTGTPAILSNGSLPSLNTGITALEVRTLIGAGTSSSSGVTSVSTSGTVSGLTLTGGPITGTGTITLGGTLSLTSANVTSALGFTPYNATNPAGYTTNTGTTTASNTQTFTNKSGNISQWTNDSGYTANVGDITGVTAGTGMTGGGTSGTVTLNVIGGTGITANANDVAINLTEVTLGAGLDANASDSLSLDLSEFIDMTALMLGTDEFIVLDGGAQRRKAANEIGLSIFLNDPGFTTNTGTITGSAREGRIAFGSATADDITEDQDFTVVQTANQERIKIAGGVQVANMNTTAVAGLAGSLRYRVDGTRSYVDMCMQTSLSGYSWVNIVQNSWT